MATPAASYVTEIIRHDAKNKTAVFCEKDLMNLIRANCNQRKVHYPVFSIIGAQSSGKSTLMNKMFNTKFEELDQRTGRKATTKGIWAAICNEARVVVLDVEGSDGAEHQDDAGFENKSALFALVVSDVIFINIKQDAIGLNQAANIPLLHTIFQERLNHDFHKTRIVFVVRDYSGKTPKEEMRKALISKNVLEVWKKISPNNKPSLSDYFEVLEVEFLPNLDYCSEQEFEKKCKEMRARKVDHFVAQQDWPVEEFPQLAKKLWDDISGNKRLDMPSYWAITSRQRCEVILSNKLSSLQSNQDHRSLRNGDLLDKPRDFHNKLDYVMTTILSEYDGEAKYYDKEVVSKVRKTLETEILRHYQDAFRRVMGMFKRAVKEEAANEIKRACGKTWKTKREAKSLVSDYTDKFRDETKGLHYYNVLTDQNDFEENLKLLGNSLAHEATEKHIRDFVINMGTATIVATTSAATGGLAAAGHALTAMAAALAGGTGAVLGDIARNESNAASDRSTHKIIQTLIKEHADDYKIIQTIVDEGKDGNEGDPEISGKGEHSGASSSSK